MTKIMIVDDEPAIVDAVKTTLETEKYDVVAAHSGIECLSKLEKGEKVDLILLDIRMPEMDGWETLQKLKDKGITNTTRVVMLTAVLHIGKDIFGLQDVVSDYIRKPFDKRILIDSIKKALGEKDKRKTLGKSIEIKLRDKELDIPLEAEKSEETERKYALKPRTSYIVEGEIIDEAFNIFTDYVKHNIPGLCITRQHMDSMREKYNLITTPILWLSKTPGSNHLSPTDLGMIRHVIIEYLEKSGGCVVLLDGIEYLITNNDFSTVLKYIDDINEAVMLSESTLLIPVDPRTLDEKELALLERNMNTIKAKEDCGGGEG